MRLSELKYLPNLMATLTPMTEFVRLEVQGRVAILHLDRPKMNALSRAMQDEIGEVAAQISANSDIRALVIYGGERTFAAGADIKEMVQWDHAEAMAQSGPLQAGFTAIAELSIPTIAAITGYALGGGCELALCCDLRIAADDATLGQPEILLGLIPGAGGTQRLARLVGPSRAKDLIFTGRFVGANESLAMGLVNEVVAPDQVLPRALEIAQTLARGPRIAMAEAKRVIDQGLESDLAAGLDLERTAFADLFGTSDQSVGMNSFINEGPGKAIFE